MTREYRLDFLRACAIFFPLIAHTTLPVLQFNASISINHWFNFFCRPGLAIFLFLAGVLFRTDQGLKYLGKKLVRVFSPYAFFSIFVILYLYRSSFLNSGSLITLFLKLLTCEIYPIYYFVFLIILCFILTFILGKLFDLEKYVVLLLIVMLIFNAFHSEYADSMAIKFFFKPSLYSVYLYRTPLIWYVYFCFGMLYSAKKEVSDFIQGHRLFIRILWLSTFIVANVLFFGKIGELDGMNSLLVLVYSILTITMLLTIKIQGRIIDFFSKISYSLYLSHVLWIIILTDVYVLIGVQFSLWVVIINFLVYLLGSILIYYAGKLIFKSRSQFFIGS